MGPDQTWEPPQAKGSDGGEPPRAETFRKMYLSGGSEGMGLEVGRPGREPRQRDLHVWPGRHSGSNGEKRCWVSWCW